MNTDSREACECKENDIAEITAEINEMMPDEENLYDLAELFKVFGDSTRIQILYTPGNALPLKPPSPTARLICCRSWAICLLS